jgi:hypothetical protein
MRIFDGVYQPELAQAHVFQGSGSSADVAGMKGVDHDDTDIVEHAEPHKRK